jgi:hypothetical protein
MARLLDPVSGTCSAPTLVGMVGMHIVQKTASFPNWVWSTFEHIDAVPAIAGESGQGTPPYALNDNNPANQKLSQPSKSITKCNPPAANPAPHQVVRLVAIASSTQTTNQLYRTAPGVAGTIWANYQLTLTQWQVDPNPKGQAYFPSSTDPVVPSNTANVAAETWFQTNTFTSCMACHQVAGGKGYDFVWFLPMGSYPQPPDPCRAMTAFLRAEKARPALKGAKAAAALNPARADAVEQLRAIVGTEH